MLSWGKDSLTCSCYHSQQFLPWIVPCSLVICGTSLFLKKTSLYLIYNLLLVLGVQRDSVYVRNAKYKTKTSLLNIHHHTYYKFIISTVLTFEISSEWQSSLGGSQVNSYCELAVWTLRHMCTMPALPLCTVISFYTGHSPKWDGLSAFLSCTLRFTFLAGCFYFLPTIATGT